MPLGTDDRGDHRTPSVAPSGQTQQQPVQNFNKEKNEVRGPEEISDFLNDFKN